MDITTSNYTSSSATLSTNTQSTLTGANSTSSNTSTTSSNTSTASTQVDSYVSSNSTAIKGLYRKPQKLTDEQIQALKDAQSESQMRLIKTLTSSLTLGQSSNAQLANSDSTSKLFTSAFCSYTCELPALATNPKDAEAAISEGGAYSIDSVATRIMDLATALAGDDSTMLAKMRTAVEKGFREAGSTFSKITREDKLPQICQDTYKEVMNRFDKLQEKNIVNAQS